MKNAEKDKKVIPNPFLKVEAKVGAKVLKVKEGHKGITGDMQDLDDHEKTNEEPMGTTLGRVGVTFLFGDEEGFKKKTAVKGFIPGKGQSMIPTREVLTAAARNLYNIMNALDQKDMVVHIHDGGPFHIKVDKQMDINVGQLPPPPEVLLEEDVKE